MRSAQKARGRDTTAEPSGCPDEAATGADAGFAADEESQQSDGKEANGDDNSPDLKASARNRVRALRARDNGRHRILRVVVSESKPAANTSTSAKSRRPIAQKFASPYAAGRWQLAAQKVDSQKDQRRRTQRGSRATRCESPFQGVRRSSAKSRSPDTGGLTGTVPDRCAVKPSRPERLPREEARKGTVRRDLAAGRGFPS